MMTPNPKGLINVVTYDFKCDISEISYFNVFLNTKGIQDTGRISGGPKAVSGLGWAMPKPIH